MSVLVDVRSPLSDQQRDYLLMTVFVFARNGETQRAKQIVDGLLAIGERSTKVRTAQAVLAFLAEDYALALNCLDRMDGDLHQDKPLNDEAARMRQYLRARCYYSVGREDEASDIAAQISAAR
ncbi:hypothetical protein [Cognatiyoonia sp. IB215182]|uniref:hypothetical protein n=1 Tax=Cognatiyoonia sp. IB215182 TaxID=3097353 RepID=UPI002A13A067|nr:hypothetical protein [Cognatiyoonia sp. IB215182]MDX8355154.1 hypothetical protein [Cognatiyoonia sp. IB215182]